MASLFSRGKAFHHPWGESFREAGSSQALTQDPRGLKAPLVLESGSPVLDGDVDGWGRQLGAGVRGGLGAPWANLPPAARGRSAPAPLVPGTPSE